ncbi:uncharacterized protein EDB91DRAFT_560101 [Suillus paluster]|uniref:uncharacterized protein n=1 Tax=Suillus paluster TaxID=48578 RepID=UPI001B870506|nr:uncharacterized protein EDB91DRAFT_560101 [Suillus paluster]KAG1718721.1 hypothetical protein EDB91DRAFT_560101 [Suillus paluster]
MPAAHRVPESSPVAAFLSEYGSDTEIYVSHLDTTPVSGRKIHFFTMMGANIAWSFLLGKRVHGALYRYGIQFILGKMLPMPKVSPPVVNWPLAGQLCLDIFLLAVLLPLIQNFISVIKLRYHHGFPKSEIVFRKPTPATVANIVSEPQDKRDSYMNDILRRAVDPEEFKHPTWGMPWDEWTMDFRAMAAAYEAEKKGIISRDAWELSVWMKMKEGWTVIEHGKVSNPLSQVGMMEKLQYKLTAMGKRHVFSQMMEVIQVKTVAKDGTALPVTQEVDNIIADIFRRNEVDFAQLTSELASESPRFVANSSKKSK